MDITAKKKNGLAKDVGYYLRNWFIVGVIAGVAMPVYSPLGSGVMPDGYFWHVKLIQLASGLAFGLVCAALFLLAQNSLNQQRCRWLSIAFGIGVWMTVKIAWFLLARSAT